MALTRPSLILSEMNAIGTELNIELQRYCNYSAGTKVFERDWDTLIILDACRYDMYAEQCKLDGDLEQCISAGSESWEFLRNNFTNDRHHDTVYVTANPHASKIEPKTFHAVENLLEDGWDPEHQTVLPEVVADAAIRAYQRYPEKRLIVHFMQPHFPFIGETGDELDHKGIDNHIENQSATEAQVWANLRYGKVQKSLVWKAYRENLDIVLPYAERVADSIPGKTVITSDHGNLVGERVGPIPSRAYGHPRGLYAPELREVPWHVLNWDERRKIVSDPPEVEAELNSELVEERLESLGYK